MRCPHCKKPPYPYRNDDGTLNWKNIFRIDFSSLFWLIVLLLIAYGHTQAVEECHDVISDPLNFCYSVKCQQQYQPVPQYQLPPIEYEEP